MRSRVVTYIPLHSTTSVQTKPNENANRTNFISSTQSVHTCGALHGILIITICDDARDLHRQNKFFFLIFRVSPFLHHRDESHKQLCGSLKTQLRVATKKKLFMVKLFPWHTCPSSYCHSQVTSANPETQIFSFLRCLPVFGEREKFPICINFFLARSSLSCAPMFGWLGDFLCSSNACGGTRRRRPKKCKRDLVSSKIK